VGVNIVGCRGDSDSKNNKKYVDRKFIILTTNLHTKLDKNGGIMTGALNMNDNKITTDCTPVNEHDVVNKKYVDTVRDVDMGSKVNKASDIMTSDLTIGENKLKINYILTLEDDAVNKKYVDWLPKTVVGQNIDSKLNISRGEITGNLDMGINKIFTRAIPR